ncbi:PHP domain-containing protein [Candidatus Fermentibacterales bacterium]|nr:PHP domain-containing protein [Candidatus Fermentibacterales bacterium]
MVMARLDLHVHSTASDGRLTPSELVTRAVEADFVVLAIADHDTVGGLPEAMAASREAGLSLLPAVELSVELGPIADGSAHLLGYFPGSSPSDLLDPANPFHEALERVRRGRAERNPGILRLLSRMGMPLETREVEEISGGGVLGRPHIAEAMVRRGYVRSTREAFDRFLARGRPAYVDRDRLGILEALEVIGANSGIPVLAHPGLMPLEDHELASLIGSVSGAGVRGIEVYYPRHGRARIDLLLETARDLDLMVTGGSDFHGFPDDSSALSGETGGFAVNAESVGRFLTECGLGPFRRESHGTTTAEHCSEHAGERPAREDGWPS